MDLAELQRRVDRFVKLDLRPFHDAYRARGGGDIDGFIAYLGAQKAIEPSVLKELYAMSDVETPTLDDVAYKGTLLQTWVARATTAGRSGGGGGAAAQTASVVSDARFQSMSRLGEGAMGAIDIARDVYLRRKVALKTVR